MWRSVLPMGNHLIKTFQRRLECDQRFEMNRGEPRKRACARAGNKVMTADCHGCHGHTDLQAMILVQTEPLNRLRSRLLQGLLCQQGALL